MNLALDIGNTKIKAALFEGDILLSSIRFDDWDDSQWKILSLNKNIDAVIVSSVEILEMEANLHFKQAKRKIILSHNTPLPIVNQYKTPETLGKDRLAAAIGAWKYFNKESCLVIDAGTCIKYDFIHSDQGFLGGSISPGMQMRLDAMHHFTARLPAYELTEVSDFFGTDTFSAMLTGVLTGVEGECRHFIELFRTRFGKINVIITGGNADFISLYLNNEFKVEKDLVLIGLNTILNYNLNNDN